LLQLGVDSVIRLHPARRVDFRRGKRLAKNDFLLPWKKPRRPTAAWSSEDFAALPESLTLRHLRLKVSAKGYRTRSLTLVTTLLDPETYPAEAIAELYFQRWSVELHFREIKSRPLYWIRCI
jgi:IS4 transposase